MIERLSRRQRMAAFAAIIGGVILLLAAKRQTTIYARRTARLSRLQRRQYANSPVQTVPESLPHCPKLIWGRNASLTRNGPKVLMSTGAYNNVVDGVSKTLNRLVGDLQQRGFQVVVIAPVAEKPAMMHNGFLYPAPSMPVPFRPEYRLALGLDKCTREFFEAYKPDIVHIATPDYLGQQVQGWAREQNFPIVCSYHTRFNSYLPYYVGSGSLLSQIDSAVWVWMRFFYNRCNHVYPPTPSVATELREHHVTTDIKIWPRGIDLELFNIGRRSASLRQSWGVVDDTPVILTVCRLVWEKNLQEIIDTISLLEKQGEIFKAVIVGEGPARISMEAQLPNVVFTGFQGGTNLSEAFASADIFFFPSLTETWGAVTLEAMASGLPVIVADAPGSKELVKSGETGFLVQPGHPQRWANAIAEILHNEKLRHRFGKNSLKKVSKAEEFTWDRATDMLVSHYSELLDPHKRYAHYFDVDSE